MAGKNIGSETISVLRVTKTDRLSTGALPEAPAHDVKGCVILPRGYQEDGKGWVVVEGKMIIAPFGADVLADDQVKIPGDTVAYEVDGAPGPYKNKRGRGKAVIFYLKRQGT